MPSIFSRIANREIPGHFVAQNQDFIAILDINPLAMGHTLVIPRKEINYIFDLENEILARYLIFSKRVASAIESVVPCKRIGMAVIGLEVPHAHIHLVPLNNVSDINFERPKLNPTQAELTDLCGKIAAAFI
jgi:histidine triad (HIT) family protein